MYTRALAVAVNIIVADNRISFGPNAMRNEYLSSYRTGSTTRDEEYRFPRFSSGASLLQPLLFTRLIKNLSFVWFPRLSQSSFEETRYDTLPPEIPIF